MGTTEKTQGRRGFVSRHGISVIFPPTNPAASYSCNTPLQQLSPQQYKQKCKGSAKELKSKKKTRNISREGFNTVQTEMCSGLIISVYLIIPPQPPLAEAVSALSQGNPS